MIAPCIVLVSYHNRAVIVKYGYYIALRVLAVEVKAVTRNCKTCYTFVIIDIINSIRTTDKLSFAVVYIFNVAFLNPSAKPIVFKGCVAVFGQKSAILPLQLLVAVGCGTAEVVIRERFFTAVGKYFYKPVAIVNIVEVFTAEFGKLFTVLYRVGVFTAVCNIAVGVIGEYYRLV